MELLQPFGSLIENEKIQLKTYGHQNKFFPEKKTTF